ncbi:MAG: glycosyltransferase [Pseudolabrys sp.]|nr:glycosyltransferase [Pseudolabrys sp.]
MFAAAKPGLNDRPGGDCPELTCLVDIVTAERLAAARDRAGQLGIGADQVLIAQGAVTVEAYLRAFARYFGVGFEPLDGVPRSLCPLDDCRLLAATTHGMLTLYDEETLTLVIAPRGLAARRIATALRASPALARTIRLTTGERLNRFVLRHAAAALVDHAVHALGRRCSSMVAAPRRRRRGAKWLVLAAGLLALVQLAPAAVEQIAPGLALAVAAMLDGLFAAWLGLRILAAAGRPRPACKSAPCEARELPTYSIVCALYQEASSVRNLLAAIARLDYPREKLQVIFALEPDDRETPAAIEAHKGSLPVTCICAPAEGPRTKPKALNAALPFVHGRFLVIYDAEDRPEPDQLRRALQAFASGGERLACVQARLAIDNTRDGWLARMFTAEYAGHFDVFLPGLARMGLPLPLGGSSNHFRTAILRSVGGWDAYNVTEDADLGIRLARFGYRTTTIASTTLEEAPARLPAWLRQRTRWFKGWMMTWIVHMRDPRRLLRELGLAGFAAFQLAVGGNAFAALVHPLFVMALIAQYCAPPAGPTHGPSPLLLALCGGTALAGYLVSGLLGLMGLARRGWLDSAWVLLLMPLHWLLLSLAAWRAFFQLLRTPYAWEKTEHGLAKTSRLAEDAIRSLTALERHLTHFMRTARQPGGAGPSGGSFLAKRSANANTSARCRASSMLK